MIRHGAGEVGLAWHVSQAPDEIQQLATELQALVQKVLRGKDSVQPSRRVLPTVRGQVESVVRMEAFVVNYPSDFNRPARETQPGEGAEWRRQLEREQRELWKGSDRAGKIKLIKGEIAAGLKVLGPICLVLLAVWFMESRRRPTNLAIWAEVRSLFEQCTSIGHSPTIALRGRALVLDMDTAEDFTGWHVASDISKRTFPRAGTFDQRITVFLVATERQEYLGNYRPAGGFCNVSIDSPLYSDMCKGASAYRARYDVCVVYWPEQQAAGMKTLFSTPPREVGNAFSGEIVGQPWDVYSWIESLPRTR